MIRKLWKACLWVASTIQFVVLLLLLALVDRGKPYPQDWEDY